MERKFDERSKSHLPFIVVFYVAMTMGAIIAPNAVSVENFSYLDIHICGFVIFQITIFDKMWGVIFPGVAVVLLSLSCGFSSRKTLFESLVAYLLSSFSVFIVWYGSGVLLDF